MEFEGNSELVSLIITGKKELKKMFGHREFAVRLWLCYSGESYCIRRLLVRSAPESANRCGRMLFFVLHP